MKVNEVDVKVNYLQLILLLLLWYGRVPSLQRVNVPALVHCLGAWAALDVTLISLGAPREPV